MDKYKKGSLTLKGAVALGTGVMIGAGIFVLLGQIVELNNILVPWSPFRIPVRFVHCTMDDVKLASEFKNVLFTNGLKHFFLQVFF
jgi:hypothetical protein